MLLHHEEFVVLGTVASSGAAIACSLMLVMGTVKDSGHALLQQFVQRARGVVRGLLGRCPRCAGPRRRVGRKNRLVCLGLGCDFLPDVLRPAPGATMPEPYVHTTQAEQRAALQQAATNELRNFAFRRHN